MLDKLRTMFRGPRPANGQAPQRPASSWLPSKASTEAETIASRQSRGLEQFFACIRDQTGLTILDLGGASQANVSFITSLGHKLYSEDFLRSMQETFGEDDADQSNPGRIEYFLRQSLDYPEETFDGVLVWDVLEYMGPPLLAAVIDRLSRITRPGSYMLAFFHSDERATTAPFYAFRIQDFNQIQVSATGSRKPAQLFNNRTLEKLFQKFDSVKFFLTRENLREVIVKR